MSARGDGLFFDALAEFGVATGIEPDVALVSEATRATGRVLIRPFDASFQPGTRYNLILFLDVLEHLPDPVAALRHAHSLLAPGRHRPRHRAGVQARSGPRTMTGTTIACDTIRAPFWRR